MKNWKTKKEPKAKAWQYIAIAVMVMASVAVAYAEKVDYVDSWGSKSQIEIVRGLQNGTPVFMLVKKDGKKSAFVFASDNLNGQITQERYAMFLEIASMSICREDLKDNLNRKVSIADGKIISTASNGRISTFSQTSDTFKVLPKKVTEKMVQAHIAKVKSEKTAEKKLAKYQRDNKAMIAAKVEETKNVWGIK